MSHKLLIVKSYLSRTLESSILGLYNIMYYLAEELLYFLTGSYFFVCMDASESMFLFVFV